MCGLCGVLGGSGDWTAAAGRPEGFGAARTRRAERMQQVRVANVVLAAFAMRLDDWQGAAFVLGNGTGKRAVVDALPAVWREADLMLGRPLDPLDPRLLDRLRGAA